MKLYEPLDVPKEIATGVWIFDGPIVRMKLAGLAMPFPTRMAVVRLASGGLWIWSPIELSPGLRAQVDALGPVHHLVSPNKLHYVHVAAWKDAYPRAATWASPGVRERAESKGVDARFERELADRPDEAWAGEIDQLIFRGSSVLEEVVFFHRTSRTLFVADLIENFEPERLTILEKLLARAGGVADPDGKAPLDLRATFFGHRDAARKCLERLVAWRPERIVIAHGRWYEGDGQAELRRAFRWLD